MPRRNILCTLGLKVCDPCFVHIRILKRACVGGICILECMRVTFCECSQRENPKRYTTTNSLFRYCGFWLLRPGRSMLWIYVFDTCVCVCVRVCTSFSKSYHHLPVLLVKYSRCICEVLIIFLLTCSEILIVILPVAFCFQMIYFVDRIIMGKNLSE